MVYVDDVVRANVLAATREEKFSGQVINIGTGERVSNNQILKLFKDNFGDLSIIKAPQRAGDVRNTQANSVKAKEQLAWLPQVSFEEGLNRTWEWWEFNSKKKEVLHD
jgi:nucleoside-diphosphate-sugar epimerase